MVQSADLTHCERLPRSAGKGLGQKRPGPFLYTWVRVKVARSRTHGRRQFVRNGAGSETIMACDLTLSELEHCLSTVVCELREQYDLANRVHDVRFKRTKMLLLENSLSTYQWLAVERVRKRDHPRDTSKSRNDLR